jgi:hypothetical protein
MKTHTIPSDVSATSGGQKVFVNVTSSASVPGFRRKQHFSSGKEVEGLHVPIAIGPPRHDVDHSGQVCLVYDVIVNDEVVAGCKAADGGGFRSLVCNIVIENIEGKYGSKASPPWRLNQRFTLPRTRNDYKGALPPPSQWIRSTRSAGIEPVSEEMTATAAERPSQVEAVAGESFRAAATVAAVSSQRAGGGPVTLEMKRLGEDGDVGDGPSVLSSLEGVGNTPSEDVRESDPLVIEPRPEGGRRLPKVEEVTDGDVQDEKEAGIEPGMLRERASRRVAPKRAPGPLAVPVVSCETVRNSSLSVGCELSSSDWWSASHWHREKADASRSLVQSGQDDGTIEAGDVGGLVGSVVTFSLDASQPDFISAVERAAGLTTDLARSCVQDVLRASPSCPLGSTMSLTVAGDSLVLSCPGHRKAVAALDFHVRGRPHTVLQITAKQCNLIAYVRARAWVPIAEITPSPGWTFRDAAEAIRSRRTPSSGADSSSVSGIPVTTVSSPAPASLDDEVLPEDRFHKQDPLSMHFLSERENARREREAAKQKKGEPSAPPRPEVPSSFDLESEADLGLL